MAELITAADLHIDTTTDQGLFDWLLASLLFGRPVPQQAAASAFRKFKADGWDTPEHFTADLAEDRGPVGERPEDRDPPAVPGNVTEDITEIELLDPPVAGDVGEGLQQRFPAVSRPGPRQRSPALVTP